MSTTTTEEQKPDLIHTGKQIVQLIGDAVALISSPSTLEAIILLHSLGIIKKGFNGYVTNPQAPPSVTYEISNTGITVTIVNP